MQELQWSIADSISENMAMRMRCCLLGEYPQRVYSLSYADDHLRQTDGVFRSVLYIMKKTFSKEKVLMVEHSGFEPLTSTMRM